MVYVNNSIKGFYWEGYELDSSSYKIGYSYQDFLDGKWVRLDSDQEKFHQDNPNASVKEVIAMQLDPEPLGPTEEELLARTKDKKISEAREYAYSDAVCSYILDGKQIWYDSIMRQKVKNDIDVAKGSGIYTISVADSEYGLDVVNTVMNEMHIYESECYDRIVAIEKEIASKTNRSEVESMKVDEGYPEKLVRTNGQIIEKNKILEANDPEKATAMYMRAMINTPAMLENTDQNLALKIKGLYPIWDKDGVYGDKGLPMGTAVVKGQRFRSKNQPSDLDWTLFEVRQNHNLQADWVPGQGGGAESMYMVVQEKHLGTIDDPIPWVYNSILENGKYYIDKEIKYLCIRDSGNPLAYENLSDLVSAGYVKVV